MALVPSALSLNSVDLSIEHTPKSPLNRGDLRNSPVERDGRGVDGVCKKHAAR